LTGVPFENTVDFMGTKWGDRRHGDFSIILKDSLQKGKAQKFELTGETGVQIIPTDKVQIIAEDENGRPVLVRNEFGKGMVYTLGFHSSMDLFGDILKRVIKNNKLLPQLEVKSIKGPACKYVERQVLGKNGRYIFYAQDYGGSQKLANIKPVGFKLPKGKYKVTDTQFFQSLQSPSGKETWTSEEIQQGITRPMKDQNPVCLLLEKAKIEPTKTYNMSLAKKRSAFLLKHFQPSPKAEKIAYIPSVAPFTEIDSVPTVRLIMEEAGFQVDAGFQKSVAKKLKAYGGRKYSLEKVDILMLLGTRYMTSEEADIIAKYVEDGGSVLVAGMPVWGNNWHTNSRINKLLKKWGLKIVNTTLLESQTDGVLSRIAPVYNVSGTHPIMFGVEKVCVYTPTSIKFSYSKSKPEFATLFSSSEKAENIYPTKKAPGSRPLCIAFKQGKGKVLVLGSVGMLIPEYLRRADNAKFLVNAVQWLANMPQSPLDPVKISKLLEIPGRTEFISK